MSGARPLRWLTPARLLPMAGLASAMFVAVTVNVLAARHFKRWDWTRGQRYSLSPATVETLHDLPDTVQVWVLMGGGDPLLLSVKQLLVAYSGETTKLDIHYVDPDKDAIQLLDVRRRFKIEAARAEDGRVVTDASIVVAHGERHWFIGPQDLVEVSESDDRRAKPREEQALTFAIRNVMSGDKTRLCFTTGHEEMSVKDGGPQGVGVLRDLLEKDNYEVAEVDPKDPATREPFKGCAVVVIAAPHIGFEGEEGERLRTYALGGGNVLAAVSPIGAVSDTGLVPAGLDPVFAPFGIALDEDVVIERDASKTIPDQLGAFVVAPKEHPVSASLVKGESSARQAPRVLVLRPRSMHAAEGKTDAHASPLLATSPQAFGVTSVRGAASWPFEGPERSPRDLGGPLVVAMASERPKLNAKAAHGPRAVVIGTGSVLQPLNWAEPATDRGAAFLVESAISWLAARPVILDIPDKPAGLAAIRISEEARTDIWRYVLLYVPASAALLGFAVALRRRNTEGRAWTGRAEPGAPGRAEPEEKGP
jgi:hypothetical protein